MFLQRRPRIADAGAGHLQTVADDNGDDDPGDDQLRRDQDAHAGNHDQWHCKPDGTFDEPAQQCDRKGKDK